MPLYEINSLDAWGNVVDGFEVNNSSRIGKVYIPPNADDGTLIRALVEEGTLNQGALTEFAQGRLLTDDSGDGVTIEEHDVVLSAVDEDGENRRYIDSDDDLEEGEHSEEYGGHRPILELQENRPTEREGFTFATAGVHVDPGGDPFATRLEKTTRMREIRVDIRVDSEEPTILIFAVVDMRSRLSDRFYHYLRDPLPKVVAYDPQTGEELTLKDLGLTKERLLVALDQYLETGEVWDAP